VRRHAQTAIVLAGLLAVALSEGCQTPSTRPGDGAEQAWARCMLLIPLAYNDGAAVPAEVQTRLLDQLYTRFGGYTVAGAVAGAYRMADGSRADERSLAIWVAVPPERITEVRRAAAEIARELRQESVYFEVTRGTVEFVEPRDTERVYDVQRDRPAGDHVR